MSLIQLLANSALTPLSGIGNASCHRIPGKTAQNFRSQLIGIVFGISARRKMSRALSDRHINKIALASVSYRARSAKSWPSLSCRWCTFGIRM
jgi:hypothetical protein